jgi:hypothetical protein
MYAKYSMSNYYIIIIVDLSGNIDRKNLLFDLHISYEN